MIDAGEESLNIALEDVAVLAAEFRVAVHRRVRSFPLPTGVRIMDEHRLEQRFDDAAQRMVNDAITEGGCGDESFLGLENPEGAVTARLPVARGKLSV